MKSFRISLIVLISLILIIHVVSAVDVALNVQGVVSGTCDAAVNVEVQGYCPGEIGNISCSVDNATWIANSGGVYGTSLTYDNAVYATGIDVLIMASNSSCSTAAYGNNTLTNAVGGGGPVTIDVNISNSFTLDVPSNGSTVNNQTINFSWTNNIVTPNSTLQIDDDSGFGSIDLTQSNIPDPNATIVFVALDGVYYWRVLTYIGSNLIQQSGVNNFTLANDAPIITLIEPDNLTWFTSSSVVFNVTTDLSADCSYASTALVSYNSKTPFSSTGGLSHSTTIGSLSEGANNMYIQCNGTNGKLMPNEEMTTLYRDNSVPDESGAIIAIDSGAVYTTNTTINVSWVGFTDAVSSISGYYVNTTNNESTTYGSFTTSSSLLLSGLTDGVITAYVWAVDQAGNIGLAAMDTIIVDTTAPIFSSWYTNPINVNQFTTSDVTVFVTINDTSPLASLPQMSYAIGSDAFSTPANMTLVSGSLYSFTIPNQASPNDWTSRAGENLTLNVTAIDSQGFNASTNHSIYINDMFTAPVFNAIASATKIEDVQTSIPLRASDADGDTLVFTSSNADMNITALNSTAASAYWTPDNDDVGSNVIIFTVTDGYFNISQAVIMNVTNVNDAPVLEEIGSLSAYEYEEFTYTLNASDVDTGDSITYSENSNLFVIGSSSGTFTFTPTPTQRGSQTIIFTASDGNGGSDSENVTLKVLYCGDNICSSSYENSVSCNVDCEEDDTSQGFIIDSKTCLGDALTIRAVELVARTTCPYKGLIINGWESCDNVSDTTIIVEQDIQDSYVEVATLLTDDFGLASYTPPEIGDYRLRYDDDNFDENMVYFGIDVCSQDTETNLASDTTGDSDDQEVNLPFFEEPLTQEQIVKLSNTSKILYFILLPFLFILLSVAATTTYYKYDKQKGSGSFSKEVDMLLVKSNKQLSAITEKVRTSKQYQKMKAYLGILEGQFLDTKQSLMKNIEPLVKNKNIKVPFFGSQFSTLPETSLLLQSIYESFFRSKKSKNFMSALQREQLYADKNLRSFIHNAHKLGLPAVYLFSSTKEKDELLALHQLMSVKKSYPTITDMKLELLRNKLVVVNLHMNALNKAAPHKNFIALLTGYTKDGFYMLDYSFSRSKKTFVPTAVFQKAWKESGYLECAIIKK